MNLIKIGNFDWPESRWEDSKSVFNHIYLIQRDDVIENKFDWVELISLSKYGSLKNRLNSLLFILLEYLINYVFLYNIVVSLFRFLNNKSLNKIKNLNSNQVYSSYNDYDRSDHLTVILLPYLRDKYIVRAIKETRPDFRYPEFLCLLKSNAIILNSKFNLKFFENKYNTDFSGKRIYFNLDEDWRSKRFITNLLIAEKKSKTDNLKHFVILSGRVFSELGNLRSGARQYYIKLIQEIIDLGQHIDLYTGEIVLTSSGLNLYSELEKKSNGLFKIKGLLDFKNQPLESYAILSRYDFGILHNFEENQKVSYFDKFNIPNRFYEYQISGVLPIVKKNDSFVVEEIIEKNNCGVVYVKLIDLLQCKTSKYKAYNPTFEDYCITLKKIFNFEI